MTVKSLLWFVMGVCGGFVLAHLVNKDPRGHEVMAELDARIGEFTDRMGDAYRDQQAQFEGLVDSVSTAADATRDAATDVLDAAKTVAKKITD